MNTNTSAASTSPSPTSISKRVVVGPVDSKIPGLNEDLRDYLTQAGFTGEYGGVQWQREFDSEIAADVVSNTLEKQIEAIVAKHLQLPVVMII